MSFVEQDDVIAATEQVLRRDWPTIGVELPTPLPRMSYAEAMRRFGSDKPDLRFGVELVECTDYFAGGGFAIFQAPNVGAVVMPGGGAQPRERSTPGRSGRGSAARRASPTCSWRTTASPRPRRQEPHRARARRLSPRTPARRPGDRIFFAAGAASPRGRCWARCAVRSPLAWT